MRDAVLAVDIGSSSCRAVLFDFNKRGIVTGRSAYAFQERRPGWMEQDPRSILRGFRESVRQVSFHPRARKYRVHCVSLSSVLHSLLPVDAQGKPLALLQTWGDNRAPLEGMERRFHARSLYHRTGCLLHPSYPFCKILWLRKHQADLFKRTAKFLSIKSFILATLFPGYVEDISVASATGLLNVRSLLWDGEALALTGLSQRRLPEVVSPYERVGQLGPERAKELGLPVGTPVIAGAGDGPLANVGGGSLRPEVVHVTVGTSAAVRAATKRPIFDSKQRLWCYRLDEDYFIFGGSSNVGAYIRQWARDRFGFEGLDQEMDMAIIRRLNSPKPLLFYPFLRGERSPHWEARLRGGLLGFSSRHDRCDFIKAAVEGVGFNLLSILDALQECLGRAGDTVCAGGGLKSKALAQILAAVFNSKIRIPKELEASARGACIVGLKAIGAIKGLTEAEDTRDFYREVTPDPERVKLYKKLFGLYQSYFPFIQSLSLELDRIEI